jgi:hypothetical protein
MCHKLWEYITPKSIFTKYENTTLFNIFLMSLFNKLFNIFFMPLFYWNYLYSVWATSRFGRVRATFLVSTGFVSPKFHIIADGLKPRISWIQLQQVIGSNEWDNTVLDLVDFGNRGSNWVENKADVN